MLSPGTIIAQRYEVIELVGVGGMSEVYKARDHKLDRFVATKILKPEFNQDAGFLKKFMNEAQSAARLSHPNIVSVFDVGEDGDLYYIVMELIDGVTLKKYIADYGSIEPEKAVDFAIQIVSAMEAAHQNGIIHRDIKPQNIMVSNGRILKVADFGIARIANNNTVTASDVVGSVHYISPEQAKGRYCDARSDIYSLGVTLYEMLTGKVPFDADNSVSVALKHLNEKIANPREINPEIPVSLVEVLEKCTQKDPELRYQTATALIKDLQKVFTYPQGGFVTYPSVSISGDSRIITSDELKQIENGSRQPEGEEKEAGEPGTEEPEETEVPAEDEEEEDDLDPKMEKLVVVLGVVSAVIVAMLLIFLVGKAVGAFHFGGSSKTGTKTEQTDKDDSEDDMVTVPTLTGKQFDRAKKELEELGLELHEYDKVDSDQPKNEIVEQKIASGEKVEKGTVIEVVVSAGKGDTVPNVMGLPESRAEQLLEDAGFSVSKDRDYDDSVPEGNVISQTPEAGASADGVSSVTITISKGSDTAGKVPGLFGMSRKEASEALAERGLKLGSVEEEYSDDVPAGDVMGQQYTEGTELESGASVNVVVSKGKKPEETTQAPEKTYTGTVTIPESMDPFEDGETGRITIKLEDGTVLDDGTMSSANFPNNYDVTSNTPGSKTVYVYLDGKEIGSVDVNLS